MSTFRSDLPHTVLGSEDVTEGTGRLCVSGGVALLRCFSWLRLQHWLGVCPNAWSLTNTSREADHEIEGTGKALVLSANPSKDNKVSSRAVTVSRSG